MGHVSVIAGDMEDVSASGIQRCPPGPGWSTVPHCTPFQEHAPENRLARVQRLSQSSQLCGAERAYARPRALFLPQLLVPLECPSVPDSTGLRLRLELRRNGLCMRSFPARPAPTPPLEGTRSACFSHLLLLSRRRENLVRIHGSGSGGRWACLSLGIDVSLGRVAPGTVNE